MKTKKSFILILLLFLFSSIFSQSTLKQFLSGTGSSQTVDWEFMVSGGRKSNTWNKIPVPSNWEMQGFGEYHYHDDWSYSQTPDSIGKYRYEFSIAPKWHDKKVDIVFGGSMTDTEVKVNGKLAGDVHQGGFYQFRYDITNLLEFNGKNLLEVKVKKYSSNTSINNAERHSDYWLFGGIFRPVWLEAFPEERIVNYAIDAKHNGEFNINILLDGISTANKIEAQIFTRENIPVGKPFSKKIDYGESKTELRTLIENIDPWSAERPNLYTVKIMLKENQKTIHEIIEKFGFRTIEVRKHDGFYINDVKVKLKGINRHSFWPTSGRTTNKQISIDDINLIKDMNMNAVRMSHYPPDSHFLEAADSLGLYVIDELSGWQAKYDTDVGRKLVKEMILRDVNHPSIILWANGNEGGFNFNLVDDYAEWDPQNRTVIHPWLNFNGINTAHYEEYNCCPGSLFDGNDLIMPTELLHGLYDGGAGAGLNDWWNLMNENPLAVGGFLWAFADEGIVRDDKSGMIDTDGNHGPDGVVGPFRQKEASFYAIKEIWSPIYFELSEMDLLPPSFSGKLKVENRFDFFDLSEITFSWKLVGYNTPSSISDIQLTSADSGNILSPALPPHEKGWLLVDLPENWQKYDAFYLTATDPHKREIYTWTWMISKNELLADKIVTQGDGLVEGYEKDSIIYVKAGDVKIEFSIASGIILNVNSKNINVPFVNGPKFLSGENIIKKVSHFKENNDYIVKIEYENRYTNIIWRILPSGWIKLDYAYHLPSHSSHLYMGITFDYPEKSVKKLSWLGKGPYRVWKNRLKGAEFNFWQKDYNNGMTGYDWKYPEFKGFYDGVYWAVLETEEMPITVVIGSDNIYMRLFTPNEPEEEFYSPMSTHVDFPEGDISFLHGIVPIGSKFHTAEELGPSGTLNKVPRLGYVYKGTLFFNFSENLR